ncbi:predicted protein [Chaetomium globosum CBS 148.51]|uniref:Uncharacterized protein n=1 Tax=Chaetomium globosum (strain ATCC 6205 / CBS 148.51 / DSM 1962 / NBRC 6347 / NRRL 1970) TaxID=306901 RepID=Q2H3G5_CHAGB|nr:uncharacterized protein CHGG_06800 [Chaetomium globosum CBS 148.51]EAQ90181.1 predicted protein [Chaetomium globosum CBS 148.51]
MKCATLFTAVALLLTSAMALPNPKAAPEAEANPQICYCNLGCYDTCVTISLASNQDNVGL